MGRHLTTTALLVGVVLIAAGCSPISSGPELPRPAQPAPTTTIAVTTTTTEPTDARSRATADCPGEFCVVYGISPAARWSDGTRVRSSDFVRTFDVLANPANGGSTDGYELISAVEVFDNRTVRVVFRERYGAWQSLFNRLLPPGWPELSTGPSTGPFRLTEAVPGDRFVLERVADWWGDGEPIGGRADGSVKNVSIVFIDDPIEMAAALAEGSVDVISARADQSLLAALAEIENVEMDIVPGPFWEHIDFHHEDPLLSRRWMRRVIDLAIDRQRILDNTIRLVDPSAESLDNTIWLGSTHGYERHYEDRHDPVAAERILTEHGCVRGDPGYTCEGQPLVFVWASTNDDPLRRAAFDSVREDLAVVGIGLVEDLRTPSDFVTREFLFGGPEVWQLINFSWRGRSDPGSSTATYLCGDLELNVNRFCSDRVDELMEAADTELEPETRADLLNEADRLYLDALAVIPLYQKPNVMAWATSIEGPAPNYSTSGDLWNLATWKGEDTITIAFHGPHRDLTPLVGDDVATNNVLGPVLYGAFGMNPSLEYLPLVIESVDVVEG